MNKTALLHMIHNVSALTNQDVEELEKLVKNFPYCQTAHLLIAKASYDKGNMLSNQKLRKAAAYATNRQLLKKLIYTTDAVVTVAAIEPATKVSVYPESLQDTVLLEATVPTEILPSEKEAIDNEVNTLSKKIPSTDQQEDFIDSSTVNENKDENQEQNSAINEEESDKIVYLLPELTVVPEEDEIKTLSIIEDIETVSLDATEVTDLVGSETTIENIGQDNSETTTKIDFIKTETPNGQSLSELEELFQVERFYKHPTEPENQKIAEPLRSELDLSEDQPESLSGDKEPPTKIIRYKLELPEDFEEVTLDHTLARFDSYLFKPEKDELHYGELKPATPEEFYEEVYYNNTIGYWMGSSRLGELLQVKDELTTHTPLQFYPDLILEYSKQNYLTPTDPPKVTNVSRQLEIIDQFLKANPKLKSFSNEKMRTEPLDDLAFKSTKNTKHLASENLANIMVQQGKIKKAVKIYEHLIVKIPEKKAYFTAQIEKLKNLI